jgi:hypothetical protein
MDENEHFGMRGLCPRKSGQFWTKPNGIPRQIRATASYRGRKVWIIINQIKPDAPLSYSGVNQAHFPALISAAGRQELCAWIERVQIAYNGGTLTDRGLTPLRPYLVPLAQEDRVSTLRILLSQDARNFLTGIRARWGKALFTD